ncbi:MAG: helix-turn-helix domain-containing protein [Ruminococcaceae bacterium]|nr:helix-turn-helix domain-containing protein [Oscillospiraceae bacterium]
MPEDRRFIIHDKSHPFEPALIGVSYCTGNYHIKRKNSPFTVMEYIIDGEGYVMKDGKFFPASKDQIYICPANTPHDYYSSSDKPWTKIWMNIYGNIPLLVLKEYGLSGVVITNGLPIKHLFEEVQSLIYSEKSNEECRKDILSLFMRIANELFMLKKQESFSDEASALKIYLDCNKHRIVSNHELSSHIFRSPDYCVKLFKREFGSTPYNYQLEQKISTACQMLTQTDISIQELSNALGYSDPQYFSNLFKSKCGMSPGAYRKKYK